MISRADIIAEARTWQGTPWRHQGRLKGIASDCIGFIVQVGVTLGLLPADCDIKSYSTQPDPQLMISHLRAFTDPSEQLIAGNILLLVPSRLPQHLAILTSPSAMIHAIDQRRGVREHILDQRWRRSIAGIYSYRGISD